MSGPPVNASTPVQPPPPGYTSDFSDPIDFQRRNMFIVTTVVCVLLSTLAVLARLYARIFIVRMMGWDDGLAIIALGLNVGLTISFLAQMDCGLAFIAWNVGEDDFLNTFFNSWIYWNSIFTLFLYMIFPVIKLSILMFYLRILGPANKGHRIGVWVLVALTLGVLVGTTAALLQMCNPPAALFYPWIPATCNINAAIFVAQAALQVFTDLLCLLPPIPFVWRLNLNRSRKIGVLIPLLIGLVVTAIGIVRMVILILQLISPGDSAADLESWQGTYLAIIEINFALIAVCLPAINQLFKSVRLAVSTMRSKQSASGKMSGSSSHRSTGVLSTPWKSTKSKRSRGSQQLPDGPPEPEGDIELLCNGKSAIRFEELEKNDSTHTLN